MTTEPLLPRRRMLVSSLNSAVAIALSPLLTGYKAQEAAPRLRLSAVASNTVPPERVQVLPVFFVASDQSDPSREQQRTLMRHLELAQHRYATLLHGVTFAVAATASLPTKLSTPNPQPAPQVPLVYRSAHERAFYEAQPEGGAPAFVAELLTVLGHTRFNCPYVFLVLFMNPDHDYPTGGGRSLNGGYNTGGGVVILSSYALDRSPNFQSTLQHELGHAFGLPHVDAYGYNMTASPSLMSYNPAHHTNGFQPSSTPGTLLPEDVRGLASNQRAFAGASFIPTRDVPSGYRLAPNVLWIGAMHLPGGHPAWEIQVTSDTRAALGTSATNIVQRRIRPNRSSSGEATITFDAGSMWHSETIGPQGWVQMTLTFPVAVTLDRIAVYTEHSGRYHRAVALRVDALGSNDDKVLTVMRAQKLSTADTVVRFPQTMSRVWRIALQTGESGAVVIRGLRFFVGGKEVFPPWDPNYPQI